MRSADQSTPGWRSQPLKPTSLAIAHHADVFTILIADHTLPSATGEAALFVPDAVRVEMSVECNDVEVKGYLNREEDTRHLALGLGLVTFP